MLYVGLLVLLLKNEANAQPQPNWSSSNIFKTDYFIENKGQYKGNEKIEYGIENGNDNISFTETGFIYHLQKANSDTATTIFKNDIACRWINTNPNCTIIAEEKSQHYFTYGNFRAYGYKKMIYKNLYKGIDMVYTLHPQGGIKYSLIIQPNVDISQLQFEYTINGKPAIIELNNNELQIKNSIADIIEKGLIAQDATGNAIAFNYAIENNKVSLIAAKKKYSTTILIDPWITPLTTLIGLPAATNKGFDVDYDTTGNLYVYGGGGLGGGDLTVPINQE
ncbi:MAG: hypothetical protein RJA07_2286 [Bacteroidota bacterium]